MSSEPSAAWQDVQDRLGYLAVHHGLEKAEAEIWAAIEHARAADASENAALQMEVGTLVSERSAADAQVEAIATELETDRRMLIKATDEIAVLGEELEIERMRLAACTTAALGNTPESVAQRLEPGHSYYSATYGDVCRAVDREMALRAENDELKGRIANALL